MAARSDRAGAASRARGTVRRRVFELEPHSERRRRQLLAVTAHILETEGPEAVRMPRVAELAGCTRTLVYRYFPQREDLLYGVLARFYEQLNARTSAQEHARGIASLAEADPERARRGSRSVLEANWDAVQEVGLGGLILARSETLGGAQLARHFPEYLKETERRWMRPLRESGLSEAACRVALDCAISITYTLFQQHRDGVLGREEALELGFRALRSLVMGLRGGGPPG